MEKKIIKTNTYQGLPYIRVGVQNVDFASVDQSDAQGFYLHNGDRAIITFYPDALPTDLENVSSSLLYFEGLELNGARLQIEYSYPSEEERINETETLVSEFKVDLNKLSPGDGAYQICLICHLQTDSSTAYCSFTNPRIEVTHEVDYSYNKTKSIPLVEGAEAMLRIPAGTAPIVIRDIDDPILGFSLCHYTTEDSPSSWRTNLDETLTSNGKLYTDAFGCEHKLEERFYSLTHWNVKNLIAESAGYVSADADGKLWYLGQEVFRDLRTPDGLHAVARLEKIDNAQWLEERYEEEKHAAEQLQSLEKYLCSFVKVVEESKIIGRTVSKTMLDNSGMLESFLERFPGVLLSSKEEAMQFIQLLEAIDDATHTEKEELLEQHDLFLARSENYATEFRSRYVDYGVAKSNFERLTENLPVTFLYTDEGEKGFNKNGALVTLCPTGGTPIYVTRERYSKTSNERRITAVQDDSGNAMRFYYDTSGLLTRVVNSQGDAVTFTYELNKLSKIARPHLPALSLSYNTKHLIGVSDGYTAASLLFNEEGRLYDFTRTTTVARVVDGQITTGDVITLASLTVTYEPNRFTITDRLKSSEEIYGLHAHHVTDTYITENGLVVYAEMCCLDEDSKLVTYKAVASPCCLGIDSLEDFCMSEATEETYRYTDFYECYKIVSTHYTPEGEEKERIETTTSYNGKGKTFSVYTKRTLCETDISEERTETTQKSMFYNEAGNLIRTESYTLGKEHALGYDIEEIFYDENGRETVRVSYNSLLPSEKLYTEKSYDSLGRVANELDETGRYATEFCYNGSMFDVRSVKEPSGKVLSYARSYTQNNSTESVITSTEAGEGSTESVYYTAGLPVCATNGRHVFNYSYDGKGRVTDIDIDGWEYLGKSYTENEDGTETVITTHAGFESVPCSVTSDKFGEVKRCHIPNIKDVSYAYTPDGRITCEADAVSEKEKNYFYDDKYRLTRCNSFDGISTTHSYDEEDRIIAKEEALVEPIASTFEYDPDTKLLNHLTVDEFSVFPAYDMMGRETKRTVWRNGNFLHGEEIAYAKYGDHATTRPSALELYSPVDALRLKYTYDAMGNIDKIYEDGILSVRYEYDALGRLTREDNRAFDSTTLWEYDKSGNILSRRTYAFTVTSTEELLASTPTDTLLYGYAGDHLMSLNGEYLFHYSAEGHPDIYRGMPVTWHAPRMLASLGDSHFSYNADGLCTSLNGQPLYYSHDGRLIYDNAFAYLYDESGSLLGFTEGSGGPKYLYRKDALGNIIAILDSAGNIVVKYKYNAWGECKVLNPNGTEIINPDHIGHRNPFRYRGYYYCSALGLYYLKSRFYDPEIGRFICADSLDYLDPHTVGGLNLFAYCGNNPVMNVDPLGCAWRDWLGVVVAAAVATIAVVACAVSLGSATPIVVAVASGAVSAGISAVKQHSETETVDAAEVIYDGLIGVTNGALATSGISTAGSVVAGAIVGGASSVGSDLAFGDGNISWKNTFQNAALGGLGGLISGPGAKKDILKFSHSQTILNNTIKNGTKRAIAHQALTRNKHAWALGWAGVRYVTSNVLTAFAP